MERHNYARDIFSIARALPDFSVLEDGIVDHPVVPENATRFIALSRLDAPSQPAAGELADPIARRPLTPVEGGFRDAAGDFLYPKLDGVACLGPEDGVLLGAS